MKQMFALKKGRRKRKTLHRAIAACLSAVLVLGTVTAGGSFAYAADNTAAEQPGGGYSESR